MMITQENRIRERAYFLWIEEGQPEGRDLDHWERARAAEEPDEPQAAEEASTDRAPTLVVTTAMTTDPGAPETAGSGVPVSRFVVGGEAD